ncbi:hypothetical protein EDB87DRAFT_1575396 [Lactarius vividus]|nr:hypothetical protein EDB87DRAFT_1575396 [Lactarius vividus]
MCDSITVTDLEWHSSASSVKSALSLATTICAQDRDGPEELAGWFGGGLGSAYPLRGALPRAPRRMPRPRGQGASPGYKLESVHQTTKLLEEGKNERGEGVRRAEGFLCVLITLRWLARRITRAQEAAVEQTTKPKSTKMPGAMNSVRWVGDGKPESALAGVVPVNCDDEAKSGRAHPLGAGFEEPKMLAIRRCTASWVLVILPIIIPS